MKYIFAFLSFIFLAQFAFSQTAHKSLRSGNQDYENKEYAAAAEKYYKALEADPSNIKGKFNLGNATYQTDSYDEAVQHFSAAAELATDEKTKANAYYNLGNSWFQKAKAEEGKGDGLKKSVEAYKNSLRINPDDVDTKKNLALTQRLLQRQQQQQQQQQKDDEKKDENQEENEEDQDKQQQDQENPSDSDQQQQEGEPQEKEQQQEKDLNKEEAMELLKIMDDEEKKVQEKMRKAKGNGKKPEKDW